MRALDKLTLRFCMALFVLAPLFFMPYTYHAMRDGKELLFGLLGGAAVTTALISAILYGLPAGFRQLSKPLVIATIIAAMFYWISFVFGIHTTAAFLATINLSIGVLLFLILASLFSMYGAGQSGDIWLKLLMVVAAINAVYSLFQYCGVDPFFKSLDPTYHAAHPRYLMAGFMDSSNMMTPLLATAAPYPFIKWYGSSGKVSALWFAILLLLLIPLPLTVNLGGIVSAGIGLSAILIPLSIRSLRHKQSVWKVMLCWFTIFACIVAVALLWRQMPEEVKVLKKMSMQERAVHYQVAEQMFADAPLLGSGPASYYRYGVEYRRAVWLMNPPTILARFSPQQAHNDYLQLAAEAGLLTLLPFIFLAVLLALRMFRVFKQWVAGGHLPVNEINLSATAGCLAILANGMVNFPFRIAPLAFIFIVMAALLFANKQVRHG